MPPARTSLLAAALTLAPAAAQQCGWVQVSTSGPPGRGDTRMVFDTARSRAVLFGGAGASTVGDDMWFWSGVTWTQAPILPLRPAKRAGFGMAYDGPRDRVVLFGGHHPITEAVHQDTWEWDGQNWLPINGFPAPPRRSMFGMVYDPVGARTLMFGGSMSASGPLLGDLWSWNGALWTQISATGPTRYGHAMAYDTSRQRVVVFGGFNQLVLGDTWEWDGQSWSQVAVAGPAPRFASAMAYDPDRGCCLLFGGYQQFNAPYSDTWQWDGHAWTLAASTGPSPRNGSGMGYDSVRRRMVVTHGWTSQTMPTDTWEWVCPCYANCDGSTSSPVLNVNDFICFQTSFAAGATTANCDGSTTEPTLNVNDFICFQQRYAAGCP